MAPLTILEIFLSLPAKAGLGQSGGQTVFTFQRDPAPAGLYQLTVSNIGHEPASVDVFSTTLPKISRL